MRDTRGITLIALVITIIVLLILAGVAISLTVGNNGLFTRARSATQNYLQAEAKEKLELVLSNISFDKNLREIDDEYIDTELEKEGVLVVGDWQFEIYRNELKIVNVLGKITNKEELLIPKIKKGQAIIDLHK